MNLYIRQKVFSWKDRFAVCDANQNPVYYVEGEFFSLGKKLHIYDTSGQEVCYIEQELFRFLPTYQIQIPGRMRVTITQRFTFFSQRFTVDGVDWEIEGDFLAHDYQMNAPYGPAAVLTKEWFTWGDTYQLTVYQPQDAILALAVVLAVDASNESND